MGLFYRESYFRQHIDREGQQHAEYVNAPVEYLATTLKLGADGKPIEAETRISLNFVARR